MDKTHHLVRQATELVRGLTPPSLLSFLNEHLLQSKSLSRQLRDSQARQAACQIATGVAVAQSAESSATSQRLKEELARNKLALQREKEEARRAKQEVEEMKLKETETRDRLMR